MVLLTKLYFKNFCQYQKQCYVFKSNCIVNTRITAVLTYLELPRAVKMTVSPIKKKLGNNLALFNLVSFFNFCSIPINDLNLCRCEFRAL